ncbi:thiamine pyrophosphate-dependent enzyme [Kitasatospora sp. NPDC002040]|uniref:thiamine pyrophosphate-binding protein n=1 Tax=Kitasatospora sp. NPDC002040 TaxID=3154661 RepID=UPI0033342FB0
MSRAPTAAGALVDALREHGVDRVFCVAGESYLSVLDALHDTPGIDVVTCRHEGSAAYLALADAKLTGRAGVCLVSRAPGAANACVGVHAAAESGVPLVVLVGAVSNGRTEQDSFQGLDPVRLFAAVTKAGWTVRTPDTAAPLVHRALRTAESGTPGPVVLALPQDVLAQPVAPTPVRPDPQQAAAASPADVEQAGQLLARARRPLLVAGAGLDSAVGRGLLREFAERHGVPVVTSNKHPHLLPNRHPHYAGQLSDAGSPGQLAELGQADLVLAVGTRLDWVTSRGRSFPPGPPERQPLVHVHPGAAPVPAVRRPTVGAACDPADFLRLLLPTEPAPWQERSAWTDRLHTAEVRRAAWRPTEAPDGVVFGAVVTALDELTGGDATVAVDSGAFTSWVLRHFRFGPRGRLLGLGSGSMGFGVPAGVAAALRGDGTVPTVVVTGDGGFLMNGTELVTACARRLPLLVLVANNNSYGSIHLHQQRLHPGRSVGTALSNPDFAKLADSFGALGLVLDRQEQAGTVLARALDHPGPVLVDIRTSLRHARAPLPT